MFTWCFQLWLQAEKHHVTTDYPESDVYEINTLSLFLCEHIPSEAVLHTMCVLSEQLIGAQENVEALPGETVTEVTDITQPDIAKEQKVETETQEFIPLTKLPG